MKPEKMISYALGWVDSPEECDPSYLNGALDTAGHMAACYLAQTYQMPVPTSDMTSILEIGDSPEVVQKKLDEYLKNSTMTIEVTTTFEMPKHSTDWEIYERFREYLKECADQGDVTEFTFELPDRTI